MKPKITLLTLGFIGLIAWAWYALKGSGPKLVTYPNTQASGVPAYQSPAITYNIGAVSPAPSPALIYGDMPPLPQTPMYQSYNTAPGNLLGLTPQGAVGAMVATSGSDIAPGGNQNESKPATSGCGCGCPSNCGCSTFQDGNQGPCVAANPTEQALSTPGALLKNLATNIASSSASALPPPSSTVSAGASPVAQASSVNWQAATLKQTSAAVAPTIDPPRPAALLSWPQIGNLLGLNAGDLSRFDHLAQQFPPGQ